MIYHYTDLTAVKSITENATVWLTEYRYLNDKAEFITGLDILRQALALNQEYSDDYPADFIKKLKEAINFINHADFKTPTAAENLFVASFSKSADSLSQWRSYGMFMLAFEGEFISPSQIEDEFYRLECHYAVDNKEVIKHAGDIIRQKIIPELFRLCKRDNINLIFLRLSELIEIYALSFKHKAFESEQEVRLVIKYRNNAPEIKFRVKGDLLIPYIELCINPLSLMSVTVGPVASQELSVASLTLFANRCAKQVQINEKESNYSLNIFSSDTPYRNL